MTKPESQKKWRENNYEKWLNYCKKYRNDNRDRVNKNSSNFYKTEKRQEYLKHYSLLGKPLMYIEKKIFVLYYRRNMNCIQIGEKINKKSNYVSAKLATARKKLGINYKDLR